MVVASVKSKNNPANEYFNDTMPMYLKHSPDAHENMFRNIKMQPIDGFPSAMANETLEEVPLVSIALSEIDADGGHS